MTPHAPRSTSRGQERTTTAASQATTKTRSQSGQPRGNGARRRPGQPPARPRRSPDVRPSTGRRTDSAGQTASAPARSSPPRSAGGDGAGGATDQLKTAGRDLSQTVIAELAAKASKKIDETVDKLEGVASDEASNTGPLASGWIAAAMAGLEGKNPLWAGLKAAWAGASTKTKVLVVTALVLLLILAPVTLVLLLLALLVVGIVLAIKRATG